MHPAEEAHQDHLGVSLASIPWAADFRRLADLDNDQERHDMTLHLN